MKTVSAKQFNNRGSWISSALISFMVLRLLFIASTFLLMIGFYREDALYSLLLLLLLPSVFCIGTLLVLLELPVSFIEITERNVINFGLTYQFTLLLDAVCNLASLIARVIYPVADESPCDIFLGQCIALAVVAGLLVAIDLLQFIASSFYISRPNAFIEQPVDEDYEMYDSYNENVKAVSMQAQLKNYLKTLRETPGLLEQFRALLSSEALLSKEKVSDDEDGSSDDYGRADNTESEEESFLDASTVQGKASIVRYSSKPRPANLMY